MVYPALLPLMRTPRLPVVDWTDAPADLNGLVSFAERRNMVSACVQSHFNWPVPIAAVFRLRAAVMRPGTTWTFISFDTNLWPSCHPWLSDYHVCVPIAPSASSPLYCIESQQPQRHLATTTARRTAVKETRCGTKHKPKGTRGKSPNSGSAKKNTRPSGYRTWLLNFATYIQLHNL